MIVGVMSAARTPKPPRATAHLAPMLTASPDLMLTTIADLQARMRALEDRVRELEKTGRGSAGEAPAQSATSSAAHAAAEKKRILEALESTRWNRVAAAKLVGLPRRTFYRRLAQYEIE